MSRQSNLTELVANTQRRFGQELRIAAMGMPQRLVAERAGMSQSEVSRIISGDRMPNLDAMIRLSKAVGYRFYFKLVPDDGVHLRDSGQLSYAETIRSQAHATWRIRFEVPVAPPPDRRAADMVLDQAAEVNMIEIELALLDFQGQLRAAQLKRAALCERLGRPVNLLIGVPDTATARRLVIPHADVIAAALPVSSRRIWAAVRSGEPVGGDGLVWIRQRGA
jgi:transcriptional regulator with XRE-family HTH domain